MNVRQEPAKSPKRKNRLYLTPAFLLLISTALYFTPAIFGEFEMTWSSGASISQVFSKATITVSVFILATLAVVAFAWPRHEIQYKKFEREKTESRTLFAIVILLMLYTLSTPALFSPAKSDVLAATDRLHFFFYNSCMVGFLFCQLTNWKKHKSLMLTSTLGLLLAVYIGHRSYLAISLAGLTYLSFRSKSVASIKKFHFFLIIVALLSLMLYKPIYSAIKDGNLELILYRISLENILVSLAIGSEQFMTYSILDQVLNNDFELRCSDLWYTPFTLIPFTDSIFDLQDCTFNNQFQNVFFYDFSGGVAANIWAEFIANFGIAGIPIFIILSLVLCSVIERISTATSSAVLISGLIIMIIQLTFYIQRNEFLSGFLLGKRAVMAAFVVFMIALIIRKSQAPKLLRNHNTQ
jgi:hypothetical protein